MLYGFENIHTVGQTVLITHRIHLSHCSGILFFFGFKNNLTFTVRYTFIERSVISLL